MVFTLLGLLEKLLTMNKKYSRLFKIISISFSSRFSEYTNPEIDVYDKEVLNENYTIVKFTQGTKKRPEVKLTENLYKKS